MTYNIFEKMYDNYLLRKVNKTKNDCNFKLLDKLKRVNYKRTNSEKLNELPLFSIHCTHIERSLYNTDWSGRKICSGCYTVPHGYQIK